MAGSSAKNYLKNGEKWIISGEIELQGDGKVTKDGETLIGGDDGGTVDIPDGSITTNKLADGAVTTEKLASNAKAPLADMADSATHANTADSAATADVASSVDWANVQNKPSIPQPTSSLLASVEEIADPENAQPADIASKINEILAALKS